MDRLFFNQVYSFISFLDVTGRSLLAQGHAYASLRDHVIKTTTVYGVTECGLLCSRDLRCKSFNVCADKNKLSCELNNATSADFEEHFHGTISCSYYSAIVRTSQWKHDWFVCDSTRII